MKQKKEARKLPNNTGKELNRGKDTKRTRIKQFKLVYKWATKTGVLLSQNKISPNNIPAEVLADLYFTEYDEFESQYTNDSTDDQIHREFDNIFNTKYLKTNNNGTLQWII